MATGIANIRKRRCPDCLREVQWAGPRNTHRAPVTCAGCQWEGPYFDSVPLRAKKRSSKVQEHMLASLHKILDFQLSSTDAMRRVEEHALAHEFADPDPESHDKMKNYASRLGMLMFLHDLVQETGLTEHHKDLIMANEVHMLFPSGRSK